VVKVPVVPGLDDLDSAMVPVPGWGVRAEWVAKVTVVLELDGLESAMVSVVLASGDLDSAMVLELVAKVLVAGTDADRGQNPTRLPTPIRT
jgi:hypothetical protein